MASEKFTVEAFLKATDAGFTDTIEKAKKSTDDFVAGAESANKKSGLFGKVVKGTGAAVAAGTAAIATGTAALVGSAVKGYAEYEQLVGGVDTLFKGASGTVQKYASEAYKTAGISANEYMEQATSFSASLISSLGGDTTAAAKYADRAIVSMSDNANKMGTDIGSIQNAYQGFAKQNYTMLDNLKLGYGGTKSEMERLVAEAATMTETQEKLGIAVDGSSTSFDNIVNAIAVVQENMGIAGSTFEEATGTIEGSFKMLQGSFKDLVTGLAIEGANIDELVGNMATSLTYLLDNVSPVIERVLANIPVLFEALLSSVQGLLPTIIDTVVQLFTQLITVATESLPMLIPVAVDGVMMIVEAITQNLPMILEAGITLLTTLIQGIAETIPNLMPTIMLAIQTLITTIIENLPLVLEAGMQILLAVIQGIIDNLPSLITAVLESVQTFVDTIVDNLPQILEAGIQVLIALVEGILNSLPEIISAVAGTLDTFCNAVLNNLPLIITAGIEILLAVIDGIINALPQLIASAADIIVKFAATIITNLPKILAAGVQLIIKLVAGIVKSIPKIIATVPKIFSELVSKFGSIDWASIGSNLVKGIWNGISNVTGWIISKIRGFGSSVLSAIKGIFGIRSPSKETEWMGEMLDRGLISGMDNELRQVERATDRLTDAATPDLDTEYKISTRNGTLSGAQNLLSIANEKAGQALEVTLNLGQRNYKAFVSDITRSQNDSAEMKEVFSV